MLELKSISRTYAPKKGVPVQALKDISLAFEDKGMVFVLGKSGSGKSTLLNLIGGLDFADSGEIVIDGKSSKDFKEFDYDSYRNTYIGFVFQEYNVLNEFTVGENISLALELQSQKDNKQIVQDVLKQVDLEGYADRKPNELSGGQKQRVAIARAIVKDPKVIMADEPTGALDSETGKAIFDTLKRLSQDRLVIVVSHDREFAEQYGDRIIELADGRVISDEKKTQSGENSQSAADANAYTQPQTLKKSRLPYKRALAMGAKTLSRKKVRIVITILLCFLSFAAFAYADTAAAFDAKTATANTFYKGTDDYVSYSAYVDKGNGSNERGKVQDVRGIDCSMNDLNRLREITGLDFQGVVANSRVFIRFYDDQLLKGDDESEYYKNYNDNVSMPASQELFDAMGFVLYGSLPQNRNEIVITKRIFQQIEIAGIKGRDDVIKPGEVGDIESFLDRKLKIQCGREVDVYTIVGVIDTFADADGALKNSNPDDPYVLNWTLRKYFRFGYHSMIFTHQSLYDDYIKENYVEDCEFGRGVSVGIPGLLGGNGVANQDSLKYVDEIIWLDGKGDRRELAENEILIGIDEAENLWPVGSYTVEGLMGGARCNKKYFNNLITFEYMTLEDLRGVGSSLLAYCDEAEKLPVEKLEIYKQHCIDIDHIFTPSDIDGYLKFGAIFINPKDSFYKLEDMNEDKWRYSYACYLSCSQSFSIVGGYDVNVTGEPCGREISQARAKRIFLDNRIEKALGSMKQIDPQKYSVTYSGAIYGNENTTPKFNSAPKIVGIYIPKEGHPADFVINDKIYEGSLNYEQALFRYLIAPLKDGLKTKDNVKMLVDVHYDTSQARSFYCNNHVFFETDYVSGTFSAFKIMAYVISGILGVFSILMLGSYMEQSISSKKREIGILRAVGAKKSDIFAIFINEGVIITAIILVLSCALAGCLTVVTNTLLSQIHGFNWDLSLLNFGIRQIAVLLAVGFGTTAIASAIPLYKLSKKMPVDCIQDR